VECGLKGSRKCRKEQENEGQAVARKWPDISYTILRL